MNQRTSPQPIGTTALTLGVNTQTPSYHDKERVLGFETDIAFDGPGLPLEKLVMLQVPSTRKRDAIVNKIIELRWQEAYAEAQRKGAALFPAPRARFEGCAFVQSNGGLLVKWSEDNYKTHFGVRDLEVDREYQANLWTINAILLTRNYRLPIGLRNPQTTDQGVIKHLTPVGFVDMKPVKTYNEKGELVSEKLEVESVAAAVARRLSDEWVVPEGAFNPAKMELLGIVYNSRQNFDYDAAVLVPLDCFSSELKSKQIISENKKGKYDSIELIDMSENSLKELLFEFALTPKLNSGHMRGDIALLIARLYGGAAKYMEVLDNIVVRLAEYRTGLNRPA